MLRFGQRRTVLALVCPTMIGLGIGLVTVTVFNWKGNTTPSDINNTVEHSQDGVGPDVEILTGDSDDIPPSCNRNPPPYAKPGNFTMHAAVNVPHKLFEEPDPETLGSETRSDCGTEPKATVPSHIEEHHSATQQESDTVLPPSSEPIESDSICIDSGDPTEDPAAHSCTPPSPENDPVSIDSGDPTEFPCNVTKLAVNPTDTAMTNKTTPDLPQEPDNLAHQVLVVLDHCWIVLPPIKSQQYPATWWTGPEPARPYADAVQGLLEDENCAPTTAAPLILGQQDPHSSVQQIPNDSDNLPASFELPAVEQAPVCPDVELDAEESFEAHDSTPVVIPASDSSTSQQIPEQLDFAGELLPPSRQPDVEQEAVPPEINALEDLHRLEPVVTDHSDHVVPLLLHSSDSTIIQTPNHLNHDDQLPPTPESPTVDQEPVREADNTLMNNQPSKYLFTNVALDLARFLSRTFPDLNAGMMESLICNLKWDRGWPMLAMFLRNLLISQSVSCRIVQLRYLDANQGQDHSIMGLLEKAGWDHGAAIYKTPDVLLMQLQDSERLSYEIRSDLVINHAGSQYQLGYVVCRLPHQDHITYSMLHESGQQISKWVKTDAAGVTDVKSFEDEKEPLSSSGFLVYVKVQSPNIKAQSISG